MNIEDIVGLIKDSKLYIELIEEDSGASFGFYNNSYVPLDFLSKRVKSINANYYDNKRYLIIKF